MIALLLLMMTQDVPAIVVSGKRLPEAYRECVERACPPLRDAQVSIAYAEKQFREGAYVKARSTLAAAVARTKRYAATAPKPVAALYEAYATVALHDGELEVYRKAVAGQVSTLRHNLPPDDPAVAAVAFATGDMWVTLRDASAAESSYRAVERRALQEGNVELATLATLRRAGLATARQEPAEAARLLAEAEARPGAATPALRAVLRVARLRLASKSDNQAQIDRLVREIGHDPATRPVLLWAPPYAPTALAAASDAAAKFGEADPTSASSSELDPIQWVDIGFWIRPDGRTSDAEILRGSPSKGWATPLLKQVAARRYSGSAAANDDGGVYRIERFSLRGTYIVPKGSLIRRRAGPAKLEVLDLTEPDTPARSSS